MKHPLTQAQHLTLKRASADFAAAFVMLRDAFVAAGEDAWTGGAVIAHTDPASYLETLRSWIEGKNYVHPGYRNRGVATWALRAALHVLAAKGATEALLTCGHDDAASIGVIEKCGGCRIADSTRRRYVIPIGDRS